MALFYFLRCFSGDLFGLGLFKTCCTTISDEHDLTSPVNISDGLYGRITFRLFSFKMKRSFIQMGMISAFYTINSILIAVGITAFVCLGVTIFSFQTKYDFTSCFGVLFVISLALLGFGIVCIFTRSTVRTNFKNSNIN
jgi:hypothetical protein